MFFGTVVKYWNIQTFRVERRLWALQSNNCELLSEAVLSRVNSWSLFLEPHWLANPAAMSKCCETESTRWNCVADNCPQFNANCITFLRRKTTSYAIFPTKFNPVTKHVRVNPIHTVQITDKERQLLLVPLLQQTTPRAAAIRKKTFQRQLLFSAPLTSSSKTHHFPRLEMFWAQVLHGKWDFFFFVFVTNQWFGHWLQTPWNILPTSPMQLAESGGR